MHPVIYFTAFAALAVVPLSRAFHLTIIHDNDVHARFREANAHGGTCTEKDKDKKGCFGGVARRATMLKKLRAQFPNNVFLDAGDQFQGTLWYYIHKGMAAAHFMKKLNYSVMALGNHEFDNYVEGLVPFLEEVTPQFPVVSANLDISKEPRLKGLVKKSVILNVAGHRIGVVGYTTTETPSTSKPGPTVSFDDEITAVRSEVDKLKTEGVKIIIALGHAGFNKDKEIAKKVDGVDVVVGGHTNTFLYTGEPPSNEIPEGPYPTVIEKNDGNRALVVQEFTFGKYLGFLQVEFDAEGHPTSYSGNPILLDKSVAKDPDIEKEVEEWEKPILAARSTVVGTTHVYLNGSRWTCRFEECNLGNLIADALVYHNLKEWTSAKWTKAGIAIWNAGSIRSSVPPGNVTIEDVQAILPYQNTIDIVEITGKDLWDTLENSVSMYNDEEERKNGGTPRFLQVSGLRVLYNTTKPLGHRVVDAKVICTNCTIPSFGPIEFDKNYFVILPSFLADGNDGYTAIGENKLQHINQGDLDSDVLMEYIKAQSPIRYGLEGRVDFVRRGGPHCVP